MDRPATRDDMHQCYSDEHKDAYGFRPRDCGDWTFEDFATGIEQLREEAEAELAAPDHGNGWRYDGDPRALDL
jgi:hypothetical protein